MTFIPPFLVYLALACLMAWRILSGVSHYMPITAMRLVSSSLGPPKSEWYWILGNAAIDYCLYTKGWPLLYTFLTGHLFLRLQWGFREVEVVFRRPSRQALNAFSKKESESEYLSALHHAVEPRSVYGKAGFNTQSAFWEMDYELVGAAYAAMVPSKNMIPESTWDLSVWKYDSAGTWNVWEVWRTHEKAAHKETVRVLRVSFVFVASSNACSNACL